MEESSNIYKFKPFQYMEIRAKNSKPIANMWGLYKAVVDSKNMYLYGEFLNHEESNTLATQIWKFNFATRKWTNYKHTENLPTYLVYRAAVFKNDVLMIYGGSGVYKLFGPNECSNELYMCHLNFANNLCAGPAVTTGDPPVPRCEQAVVYHGGYLYVVGGGTDSMRTCDIHRINVKTFVWEAVYACKGNGDYEPQCTLYHRIACDGESIVMFAPYGGLVDPRGFREIAVFNMKEKKWTKGNIVGDSDIISNNGFGYPREANVHDIYHHDTKFKLYVWERYPGYKDDVRIWQLDLKTFQWTRICTAALPTSESMPLSAPADNEVCAAISPDGSKHYIIDHSGSDIATSTPDIYVTWLEIPKLSEICWEAVLHYLKVFDEKELIRAGVPRRYVNSMK